MEQVGLRKAKDLLRLREQRQHHRDEEDRSRGRPSACKTTGVRVRPINMKDFRGEVERVWEVYNAAWSATGDSSP